MLLKKRWPSGQCRCKVAGLEGARWFGSLKTKQGTQMTDGQMLGPCERGWPR